MSPHNFAINLDLDLIPSALQTQILSENSQGINSGSGAVVSFQEMAIQYSQLNLRGQGHSSSFVELREEGGDLGRGFPQRAQSHRGCAVCDS